MNTEYYRIVENGSGRCGVCFKNDRIHVCVPDKSLFSKQLRDLEGRDTCLTETELREIQKLSPNKPTKILNGDTFNYDHLMIPNKFYVSDSHY